MATSRKSIDVWLKARTAALLLLLAAVAAPAQACCKRENSTGGKSSQNADSILSPTPQTLELQQENVTAQRYDASGDSFTWKERSEETG